LSKLAFWSGIDRELERKVWASVGGPRCADSVHPPPLVECCGIPLKPKNGLTPISCHAVLERSACAPFIKERRMESINATSLRRKSGQWGTQPRYSYIGKFEVVRTRQLSHPLPVRATKGGCPIQAVFWLEWDTTAFDQRRWMDRVSTTATNPFFFPRSLHPGLFLAATATEQSRRDG
jgi:hypothetical protein